MSNIRAKAEAHAHRACLAIDSNQTKGALGLLDHFQ